VTYKFNLDTGRCPTQDEPRNLLHAVRRNEHQGAKKSADFNEIRVIEGCERW
jgi:hypothetical protein